MNASSESMFRVVTSPDDLLRVYCVRSIVFIGEQACPFAEEFDGLDTESIHILGEARGEPIAAARLRRVEDWIKLERIAVVKPVRGGGLGHRLVDFMLEEAERRGFHKFKMHAQVHLEAFYAQHGFARHGEMFVEAGIDHYLMLREDGPDIARAPARAS
jgi:predicted GNAT family N-acyltransferase